MRVQAGRLRQKLEDYYAGEGASDPLVLEVPKGRFTVVFRPRAEQKPPMRERRRAWVPGLSIGVAILSLAWAAFLTWSPRQAPSTRQFAPFWRPFLERGAGSVVVFGSPPFFGSSKYPLFVRLYDADNPDNPRSSPEFDQVDASVGPLAGPRFDYALMGDAIAVQRLTAFFASAGVVLKAMPAHLAVWDSILDSHLIFLGAWRMHPLLRKLPIQPDFELGRDNFIHNRNPGPGEQALYTTPSHRDTMTYAIVAAYPGLKPGRETLVITAHSSPGAMGAVDFITGQASLGLLQQKLGLAPGGARKYFEVLLRIYVDNDLPVKVDYVTHHILR